MKKYIIYILCGILIISAVINSGFTYTIHNNEVAHALENKDFYGQNDILMKVYEFECENGVGGVVFDVSYDGDNLDFYDVIADSGYTAMYRDNHVGKLTVGMTDKNVTENSDTKTSVKIAVGFKPLYTLESSYISFSYEVNTFADGNIKKSDNYNISESLYVYDNDNDIEYEDYVRTVIGIDLSDTDTDINTETDIESDTDTNTETDSDTDTDTDIDTDTSTAVEYIFGDVDNDRSITSADSLYVLRNSVELEYFTPVQMILADVDRDGEITAADSLEILRYSVSLPSNSKTGEKILI